MTKRIIYNSIALIVVLLFLGACNMPENLVRSENTALPDRFTTTADTNNSGQIKWRQYFDDPYLIALIDSALSKNQELNITLQEIELGRNEIRAKKGEYLPFVGIGLGAGAEKAGEFTRDGSVESNLEIENGTPFPEPLPDFMIGAYASWEIDVWKKLRNGKKAAVSRFLASVEGKNFMVTNLIAEIAKSYFELMALDNLLDIVQVNVEIQNNALKAIKQEKEAAKVSQLAVNRFEAQLLNTQNRQFEIRQRIVETENKIRFLTGGMTLDISRNSAGFNEIPIDSLYSGIPSQLLQNRPDIRQVEMELAASKFDVQIARANFYPSFRIDAGAGFRAFKPAYLVSPESMIYSLAGELMAPVINRNAIKAEFNSANAKQLQIIFKYEQTILNAYLEVRNQLSMIDFMRQSFDLKSQEVDILTQSITISNNLYRSARADYMEVLLTQREALESRIELIEIKMKQLNAKVDIYKALGGGWK